MNRRPIYIKLVVFLIIAGVMGLMEMGTLTGPHVGKTQTYHAIFGGTDGSSGLRPGNWVKVSGVAVGKVNATSLVDATHVEVTFTANSDQVLDSNTWAVVRYANLLGQRYLALDEEGTGQATRLNPGQTIPQARTRPALSLTALFNGFRPLFAALSPSQVNELSNDIIAVLQGQTDTLSDLVLKTASLTSNLSQRNQTFSAVIDSLAQLLGSVSQHDTQLAGVLTSLHALTSAANADAPTILASINGVDSLMSSVGNVVQGLNSHGAFAQDVADLRSLTGLLNANQKTMLSLIGGFVQAFSNFDRISQNGAFLNVYPCNLQAVIRGNPGITGANVVTSLNNILGAGGPLSNILNGALGSTLTSLTALAVPVPINLPAGTVGSSSAHTKVCG